MNNAEACFACCIKDKAHQDDEERLSLVKNYTGEFEQIIQGHSKQIQELNQKIEAQNLLISKQQQKLDQITQGAQISYDIISPKTDEPIVDLRSEITSPQSNKPNTAIGVLKSPTSFNKQETKRLTSPQMEQNGINEKVIAIENQLAQQGQTIQSLMEKLSELESSKVKEDQTVTHPNTEIILQKELQQSQEPAQLEQKITALEEQVTTKLSEMNQLIKNLGENVETRLAITDYQKQMAMYLKVIEGGLKRIGVLEGKK